MLYVKCSSSTAHDPFPCFLFVFLISSPMPTRSSCLLGVPATSLFFWFNIFFGHEKIKEASHELNYAFSSHLLKTKHVSLSVYSMVMRVYIKNL